MEKYNLIEKIVELYNQGGNIIQYLREKEHRTFNTTEDILISYDFQAGSYIRFASENPEYINSYTLAIADIIKNLISKGSIVEVGVGEATTLGNVARKLPPEPFIYGGFDISWSRIFYARKYLSELGVAANLFTADLFKIPLADNSIDLIYSSHSIEPNGGRERDALKELYRVTSKYLVLLEPAIEYASNEGKERMKRNGYITNLKNIILDLNYKLIEYRKFEFSSNPLNPTALYVIEKNAHTEGRANIELVCPISKAVVNERPDHFFSPRALVSYPKVMGIPCFLINHAILTTKMS